eukprot:GGOE01029107.1.p2 GENE.GGOE01029107.1~~GGOE01029107.1.p2  ORF type:complete len:110 (-),score=8.96 GGOE01029107.1:273-602(-)
MPGGKSGAISHHPTVLVLSALANTSCQSACVQLSAPPLLLWFSFANSVARFGNFPCALRPPPMPLSFRPPQLGRRGFSGAGKARPLGIRWTHQPPPARVKNTSQRIISM